MSINMKSKLNLGPFKDYPKKFRASAKQAVLDTTFSIIKDMRARCPIDTGALRESIYAVTKSSSGYSEAVGKCTALRPNVPVLPEIPSTNSDYTSKIGIAEPYWDYVETGTSFSPAQPFVTPAVNKGKATFAQLIEKASAEAASKSGWNI